QPESEQRRLGCVRARLECGSTQGARWSAHASGARLQTGPERDLDPVETVRRPPTNDRGEDTVRSRQQWREADRKCSARQIEWTGPYSVTDTMQPPKVDNTVVQALK